MLLKVSVLAQKTSFLTFTKSNCIVFIKRNGEMSLAVNN